jgi:trans-aconitate 2-methyltransferase
MRWDPAEYLRYADERGRPFHDLVARIGATTPATVVDLGCGPGNLTVTLAHRWPAAQVEGVDSSPDMVERAALLASAETPGLRFRLGDVRDWAPVAPVDVLVSNATFQWVPAHLDLLPRLLGQVAAGGWFAFQVPGNFDQPSHTEIAAVRTSQRWRGALPDDLATPSVEEPVTYVRRLAELGCVVDAWESTYLQVLPGEDAVLQWLQGTALRPVLTALGEAEGQEFLDDLRPRLRSAYPREAFGTVLPYRRIFVVAHKPSRPEGAS